MTLEEKIKVTEELTGCDVYEYPKQGSDIQFGKWFIISADGKNVETMRGRYISLSLATQLYKIWS